MELKLDYKKTIKVGFAFAIISMFWGAYDFVVPLLLENAFGLSNTLRGLIMGLDNLLSLFLLPLFGKFSDKTKTRFGKRTPYIFFGTILAVVLMIFIPVSSQKQMKQADAYRVEKAATITEEQFADWYDNATETNAVYVDINYCKNNDITREKYIELATTGIKYYDVKNTGIFTKNYFWGQTNEPLNEAELAEYKAISGDYNKFVKSGVTTYLSQQVETDITKNNIGTIAGYMVILFFVLVAMATFRSPAVALMPDVTPKPLRSQANAIINLAGGLGGAIAFLIYTVAFFIDTAPFIEIFACVAGGMLLLLVGFMLLVKEPKLVDECHSICEKFGITDEDEEKRQETELVEEVAGKKTAPDKVIDFFKKLFKIKDKKELATPEERRIALQKAKRTSFFLILASIFMWFMGYNAISSNLSIYCTKVLNLQPSIASVISGVSMGISAIAFIPVGYMAVKFGRRKTIMFGFALASLSFLLIWIIVKPGNAAAFIFAAFYLIAGFGQIIANVNTFPMVVELSTADNIGKYTGFYYTATMSAQAITPFIAGLVMDNIGNSALFGYSMICILVSIALMFFVKHGDSKAKKVSKLEMMGADAD